MDAVDLAVAFCAGLLAGMWVHRLHRDGSDQLDQILRDALNPDKEATAE